MWLMRIIRAVLSLAIAFIVVIVVVNNASSWVADNMAKFSVPFAAMDDHNFRKNPEKPATASTGSYVPTIIE